MKTNKISKLLIKKLLHKTSETSSKIGLFISPEKPKLKRIKKHYLCAENLHL